MSAVQLFAYADHQVRVVSIDGEPWFVLADLCKVLDIANPRNTAARLADDMKGVRRVDTLGGPQQVTVVSEAGMYEVVIRSDKPEAAAFRRWITTEVLPAIRKHGFYGTDAAIDQMLGDPDVAITMLTRYRDERAARPALEAKVEADAPKVIFADAVSASHTSILVGDLAKLLKGNGVDIGAIRLFAILRREGYLISRKGTDWNRPTQRSMDLGLFEMKETTVCHADGHTTINLTPKVTGKGQTYFVERFLNGRIAVA